MERYFNTTGPCFPDEHYMLPPERRLGRVLELIERNRYFVFHAGRQTGKTTSLVWLEEHLPKLGKRAHWLDIQTAREQPNPAKAFRTIFSAIERDLDPGRDGLRAADAAQVERWLQDPNSAVRNYLMFLSEQDPRPFVLMVDEADGLVGEAMVSFLTQIRDGYLSRHKRAFPASLALVGMRQVRDYPLDAEQRRAVVWLGTTSPFNVSAESTSLASFTEPEVTDLLEQHTAATGQRFEPEAVKRIWDLAEGHPWLTNALADQIVSTDVRDRSAPVTAAHVEAAKETIISERRTHIDSLIARLREPRVIRILAPMLMGDRADRQTADDDFAYVIDLGLLRLKDRRYQIANAVYKEVIPRALTFTEQAQLPFETAWYVRPDGLLDMLKLMEAWQSFWRRDGHLAADGFRYKEAGPHLMLMAFLQRIVNGGGQIAREYGLGRGALDLMISWRDARYAIEMKLRRDTDTEDEALDQLAGYLEHANLGEGWLVLFDLRKEIPWTEKLSIRDVPHRGKTIHVVGC